MPLDVEDLEQQIERDLHLHHVPGFALTIVQGNEIAYAGGFGVTSVEDGGLPVTSQTLFCSGSISKPLAGATIMRLVEQGMLALDTPVIDYVPWLTFSQPEFARAITLRRLLSHTSGLFGTGGDFGPRDLTGLETFIHEAIPLAPFVAPPGKVFEYCNLGVDLAGYVAEVAAGKHFPEVVQEQVLGPLYMKRTTYDRTVAMTYPVALPHVIDGDGVARVQHRMFDYAAANPAGQVIASTSDLANFALMVLHEGRFGGDQVLSPASVREMLRPQALLRDLAGSGYGLTFWTLTYKGHEWVTHAGLLTPYMCELSLIPERGIAVVFQCNITNEFNPYAIRRRIFDQLLDLPAQSDAPAPEYMALDKAALARHTGTYLSLAAGLVTIGLTGNQLTLQREDNVVPLNAIHENLFSSEDGEIAVGFVPEGEGSANYFMLDEHPYRRRECEPHHRVSQATLEAYVGQYLFDDGDTVSVRVQDGDLYASFSWLGREHRCISLSDARFACQAGLIEFRPDAEGGFVLAYDGFVVARRMAGTGGAH